MALVCVALIAIIVPVKQSRAGETKGYIGGEVRGFFNEGLYSGQSDDSASLSANIDYYHEIDDSNRFVVNGFARLDSDDSERSHADLRELYWRTALNRDQLYLGVRKLFWGVTETVHLVDIINQDDLVENIDGEDKLGQPMVSLQLERDWGSLELFGLIGFRERTFPGRDGRLRPIVPIDGDRALYQSSDKEDHIDFALRWSRVIDDMDIGLSHFSGTSRDPILLPAIRRGRLVSFRPYYQQIDQTGLDLQLTREGWLWKLEAASIKYKDSGRNTALVGGFEYTLYGIAETTTDLGLLLEYQFDDRTGANETSTQNDLAFGGRWTLNDVQGTALLAVMAVDLDQGTRFLSVETSRRLSNEWSIEAEMRVFSNVDRRDPTHMIRDDDYLQVELKRYF